MKKNALTLQHQFLFYMIGTTVLVLCLSLAFSLWIQHALGSRPLPTESALIQALTEAATTPASLTIPATQLNPGTAPPSNDSESATVNAIASEGIQTLKSSLVATTQRQYLTLIALVILAQLIGSVVWVRRMLVNPIYSTIQKVDTLANEDYSLAPCSNGPHELDHLNHQLYVLSEAMRQNKHYRETEAAKKKALIAGMSHDLKTPLTNICGYTETLLMEDPLNPEHQEWLTIILRNAQMANRLISDLLDLNRYDLAQHPIHITAVPVDTLLQTCMDDAAQLLTYNGQQVELILNPPDDQKDLPNRWNVQTDSILLMRLVKNLISNFNQHAGAQTTLAITVDMSGEQFSLTFKDNGIGVPASEVPNLTDIFYIGDQARTHTSSSGLGLYNCQQIVELLGGNMVIDSDVGRGMSLVIQLHSG